MKYRDSFYDHSCTEEIADHVIDGGLWYELHESPRNNDQVMYVGFDAEGTLWEIGIELFPNNEEDWAFHADKATAKSIEKVGL